DGDLQRHLVLALDLQEVDDLRALAVFAEDGGIAVVALGDDGAGGRLAAGQEDIGELARLVGVLRRAHGAVQNDIVGDDLHLDVGIGNEAAQVRLQPGDVAFDVEVYADDLLAARPEDEDIGLADI